MSKWITIPIVGGSLVLLGTLLANGQDVEKAVPEPQVRAVPLTIAMSTLGRFGKGDSWYLSVNSAGKAQLTIESFPQGIQREFDVSAKQLEDFRKVLLDARFFELADEYGEVVFDGSTTTLTVTAGDVTKSVKLRFLMNWVHHDKAKLRDPSRAVRVGMMIRDWFDDAEAVDLRKYNQMVLDAAEQIAEPKTR